VRIDHHLKENPTETLLLKLSQFAQAYHIPFHTLTGANAKADAILLDYMDGFELRLLAYLAEHVVVDRKLTFPTTWWDAVKERFLPEWLKARVRISHTTVEVKVAELATKWRVPEELGSQPYMVWRENSYASYEKEQE